MLILSRKPGESFFVGNDIEITISEISGDRVKVVIDAPKEIVVLRKELKELKDVNQDSVKSTGTDLSYLKDIFKR